MKNFSFERLNEMMNKFNATVNESVEESVFESMLSEERQEQIQEIDEMLLAMYDSMQKLLEKKEEIERVEAKYQRMRNDKSNVMNKIKGMFGKQNDKETFVSDAQIDHTMQENELRQLSYDISGKINALRMKVSRTDLEEYELASLISQLNQINDILS